jgi:sugar lactone lactonase YvrE
MGQDAVCIWAAGTTLGEGALWLAEEQALYWVDILQPRILRHDPATGAQAEWPMPEPIGFIAPRRRGGLVAGLRSGFHLIDLPDGRILYEADSERRVVYAYDLDLAGGAISNRRPFVIFAEDDGVPDGMTVDRDGHLWVAHWGGSRVSRFRPDGTLDRAIAIPAPHVTSCTFGGPGLTTLYVTTARSGMSEGALRQHPLAGGLFQIKDAGRGLPGSHFAG